MISALDGVCQEWLSEAASREDSPAPAPPAARRPVQPQHWPHWDAGGSTLPVLPSFITPCKADLKESTWLDPLKTLIQRTPVLPDVPFFWEFTPRAQRRLKALCLAQPSACSPRGFPRRCPRCEPLHPPSPAFVLLPLPSTPAPSHSSSLLMCDPQP